jgi:uncharacterized membrane protein YfcA
MPDTALFWPLALTAAVLVGLGKGGLPIAGMLGTPILALVMSPVQAAGLLLPVFIVSDLVGLYAYRREFDARVLRILIPACTLGVVLGGLTASVTPEWLVTLLVGVIGLVFSLYFWVFKRLVEGARHEARLLPGAVWGTLTGFTSFVSHAGAPPYQVYVLPLGLSKLVYAGTTTILFAYVNAIKLVPYWALGQLNPGNLKAAAILSVPAMLAVMAGVWLVRVLPEKLFFQLALAALFLISLKLVWDGGFAG